MLVYTHNYRCIPMLMETAVSEAEVWLHVKTPYLTHWLTLIHSLCHSIRHSFYSFTRPLTFSVITTFTCLLLHALSPWDTHPFTHCNTQVPIRPLIYQDTHSLNNSLAGPLTHWSEHAGLLTGPLTHWSAHPLLAGPRLRSLWSWSAYSFTHWSTQSLVYLLTH